MTLPAGERDAALFLPSYRGGGAERVMITLANGLARAGLATDLVVCDGAGPLGDEVDPAVRPIVLGSRRVGRAIPALARYLRVNRPRVLLSTMAHANIAAACARALSGWRGRHVMREATTWSGQLEMARGLRIRLLARAIPWFYRRADRVLVGSRGAAADLARLGLAPERIEVLPNPLDLGAVRRGIAGSTPHPWLDDPDVPVLLAVGRLDPVKGFDLLLEAFAAVRARRPARLILLGEGPQRDALLGQSRALGVADDVDLPGFVSSPYGWMARCAVFVLPSRREGAPNVLVQALACGCRVVAADCVSGPAEILDGGRFGTLVRPEDPSALAAALDAALDAPAVDAEVLRRRAMGHDIDAVLPDYRRVLGL